MAVLDGIKDRLGFSKNDDSRSRSRNRRGSRYDDYDDGYDGYDDGYDDDFQDDYADDYDEYGEDGDEDQYGSLYAPVTTRTSARSATTPRLVSFKDVKDHSTRMDAERSTVSSQIATSTTASSTATQTASRTATPRERSEGLNSLFEPSTPGTGRTTIAERRTVTVVAPTTYNDVANVASVVRDGNVIVLDLSNTPDSLRSHVLDFCFGVASALDARVDAPAQNVYAVSQGQTLTAVEKSTLKAKGVL